MGIYELLDSHDEFELTVAGSEVVVRRTSPDERMVYLKPHLKYIGKFVEENRGRATYYVSELASEPGTVNWVSDDVATLVSRMLTLRE